MAVSGMHTASTILRQVTPELAGEWLAKNVKNRRIRAKWVAELASTIKSGGWKLTHQGIAFFEDGTLADGQHRLSAIVKAGVTVPCFVTMGLSRESAAVTDIGKTRNLPDIAGLSGSLENLTSRHAATALSMWFGVKQQSPQASPNRFQRLAFIEYHRPAIDYAIRTVPSCPWRHSSILGVIARAYYHEDHERIQDFAHKLRETVEIKPSDSAATTFARWYLTFPNRSAGQHSKHIVAARCETALKAFCEYKALSRVVPTSKELYPIAEDNAPQPTA